MVKDITYMLIIINIYKTSQLNLFRKFRQDFNSVYLRKKKNRYEIKVSEVTPQKA